MRGCHACVQDSSEMFDVYEPPLAEERGGLLTRVVRAGYSKARGKVGS